jgi:hypothetical protein
MWAKQQSSNMQYHSLMGCLRCWCCPQHCGALTCLCKSCRHHVCGLKLPVVPRVCTEPACSSCTHATCKSDTTGPCSNVRGLNAVEYTAAKLSIPSCVAQM